MSLKKYVKNPYLFLLLSILITGLIIYAPFIFGKYIFAYNDWGYDTRHSYLPAMEFYANKLSQFRLNDYDFSYGPGSSIFANMQMFTDIFNMFIIIIGSIIGPDKIGLLLIYIHIVKSIAIGLMGFCYLKLFNFSTRSSILSAYIMAFSGYILITGQHYFFATYAVLFMLSLLLTELSLRNEKKLKYMALSLALQGIVSPYVLFPSIIMLGVYCIIRLIQLKENETFIQITAKLIKFYGYMILGTGISMVSFLPQTYEMMMVSQRLDGSQSLKDIIRNCFTPVSFAYIKTGFGRLFSNNLEGLINSWEGAGVYFSATPYYFSIFFPVCIVYAVYKTFAEHYKKSEKIIRIGITFSFAYAFLFNGIPLLFNLFAYIQYRYIYIFIPFFAIIMAECLDDLLIKKKFNTNICVNTIICSTVILICGYKSQNIYSKLSLSVAIILMIVLSFSIVCLNYCKVIKPLYNLCIIFFYGSITISIIFESFISLYAERSPVLKQNYTVDYHMPYLTEFEETISNIEGNNFVRCDRTFIGYDGSPDVLFSFITPIRTTSIYNSVLSKYLIQFTKKMMDNEIVTQAAYSLDNYGLQFDSVIATVLGLKYVISDKKMDIYGWKIISEYEDKYLYQNQLFSTAGLIYSDYITEKSYEELSSMDKKFVMQQAVVLENDPSNSEYMNWSPYYNKNAIDNIVLNKTSKLVCRQKNNTTQIYGPADDGDNLTILLDKEGNSVKTSFLSVKITLENKGSITLNTFYNKLISKDYSYQCEPGIEKEIIIPVGEDSQYLKLVFPKAQIRSAEIQLYSSTDIQYKNSVQLQNPKMGNCVYGTAQTDTDGILFIPIVYDKNWNAYVNDQKVDIIKADYGFLAIELPKGKNQITIRYINKSLYAGGFISLCSLIMLLILSKKGNLNSSILRKDKFVWKQ